MKKLVMLFLTLVLILNILPVIQVSAADTEEIATSGYCGDPNVNEGKNVTWTLDTASGTLTIAGMGAMAEWPSQYWAAAEIIIPVKIVDIKSGVTSIGNWAFALNGGLSSVTIPESITEIGSSAFMGCFNLTSISIPKGTTRIGECAFEHCRGLTSITLSEGLTVIGECAFNGCDGLTSIVLPEGIKKIEMGAFLDTSLSTVTIPASVTEIGARVFESYVNSLTDVYYGGTEAQWNAISIDADNDALKNATIHFSEPDKVEFKDIPANAYYHDAVMWAVENGITTGTGDGTTFEPNAICTRGQVVTFLWRAAGKPEPTTTTNPFTDVKSGDYFYKAVLWAVENRITNGTGDGTTFEPNANCNRAQIVTFLSRAKSGQPTTSNNPFKDVPAGSYYYNPVLWAVENRITTGTGDGTTFEPNSDCTRGQVITFLWRAYTK